MSLLTVYYITGIAVGILAVITGGYGAVRYWGRKKTQWQDEGRQRERHARLLEDNTAQVKANTAALTGLSAAFGDFAGTVRTELNSHEARISRLETGQPGRRGNHGLPP